MFVCHTPQIIYPEHLHLGDHIIHPVTREVVEVTEVYAEIPIGGTERDASYRIGYKIIERPPKQDFEITGGTKMQRVSQHVFCIGDLTE